MSTIAERAANLGFVSDFGRQMWILTETQKELDAANAADPLISASAAFQTANAIANLMGTNTGIPEQVTGITTEQARWMLEHGVVADFTSKEGIDKVLADIVSVSGSTPSPTTSTATLKTAVSGIDPKWWILAGVLALIAILSIFRR